MGAVLLGNYKYEFSNTEYLKRWIILFLISEVIMWVFHFIGFIIPYTKFKNEEPSEVVEIKEK